MPDKSFGAGTLLCLAAVLLAASVAPGAGQSSAQGTATQGAEARTAQPESRTNLKLGGVTLGGFYSHVRYPFHPYYPYYAPYYLPYGWYPGYYWDSYWHPYGAFYHPGYFLGFAAAEGRGQIRLVDADKQDHVFINGGYAGIAGDLKSMWLDAGVYDLEVKRADRQVLNQKVYVLSGKTVKLSVQTKGD
jgi:hypothetical protein